MRYTYNNSRLIALAVTVIFAVSGAWSQTIYDNYSTQRVRHKLKNKWHVMRNSLSQASKDLDTFDDETEYFTSANGEPIQPAHTYIDTMYVRKGSNIELSLPTMSNGGTANSARSYQRWYNMRTEGSFYYSGRGTSGNLLSRFSGNTFRFANGYVSGIVRTGDDETDSPLITSNGDRRSGNAYKVQFHYPTDDKYAEWGLSANGFDDNNFYVVACDVSGYTDFTENPQQGSDGNFGRSVFGANGQYWEPTLSLRVVYYIVAVDGRTADNSSDMWKNGYGRLFTAPYYEGGGGANSKYLEEYNIEFPCNHLGDKTNEVVALSKDALGYRIDGDDNDGLTVAITGDGKTEFSLLHNGSRAADIGGTAARSFTLSGKNRVIAFRPTADANNQPWTVAEGTKATITVRKTVGNRTYNIARFNLTFSNNSRILTQHQIDRIDRHRKEGNVIGNNEIWYLPTFMHRTPEYLRENYKLLTSRTFDYDPEVMRLYGQPGYYEFPLSWGYSSYAFYDGAYDVDFSAHTNNNGSYDRSPFAEWGSYAITNDYIGYGDKTGAAGRPVDGNLGGRNGNGNFLYVDASDRPGTLVVLPFEEKLCAGTEIFVSAWVKGAESDGGGDNNSAMLYNIYGVINNEDGRKTKELLFSHSTGQIPRTTWLNEENDAAYTAQNGFGSGQNDWYQMFFSFVNDDEKAAAYDYYELKIDNNCAGTTGGDYYLDDIEVYIAQPSAAVTQKDFACTGERTLLRSSLNWKQLCERLGLDPDETDLSKQPEGIDFCFVDETEYNRLITDGKNPEEALTASVVMIGVGDDEANPGAGYNKQVGTLMYKLNFEENTEYNVEKDNLAIDNRELVDGELISFFYRTGTKDAEDRTLTVDFYSEMSPNRPYLMLIADRPTDGTTTSLKDFSEMIGQACGIQTRFYVTGQTLIKINGEAVDPQTDYCIGQAFNFTVQLRVPKLNDAGNDIERDPETGEEIFVPVDSEVYFDWFFGYESDFMFVDPVEGVSLHDALQAFREIPEYRDKENLDGVVPTTSGNTELTQNMIDVIKAWMETPGTEGGRYNKLVLHKSALDIVMLKSGLQVVVSPIPAVKPSGSSITDAQWEKICWNYIPLQLTTNGSAPRLFAGLNRLEYPESVNPGLRIGLAQIKEAAAANSTVRIDLRGAQYTDEKVESLGLIDNPGSDIDYSQIYLIDTDDPEYTSLVHVEDFNQFSYPIGKIDYLHAQEYSTSSQYQDYADVRFYLDEQTLANGDKFTFKPREGYSYTFSVFFSEQGRDINNSCWGSFPMKMKVVPEYVVWNGNAEGTSNWNNDNNWRRATKADLKKPAGYEDYADGDGRGFVPMLFTDVVMPKNSKVELYAAGLSSASGTPGTRDGWVTGRPDYMEEPTENIQYDLMVHKVSGRLTTQPYRVSLCDNIHFSEGAQMLNSQFLLYQGKANVELSVAQKKWTMVSVPLKNVYAGDWYTKTSTASDEQTELFSNITFGTDNSRLNPMVYQRSWGSGATVYKSSDASQGVPASLAANWSAVYNDTGVEYQPGEGFSVSGMAKNGDKLQFRFPKADNTYTYGGSSLNRGNAGKLMVTDMYTRNVDIDAAGENEPVEVTLEPSGDGNYCMVGNPFLSAIDIQAFLSVNRDVLEQKYWAQNGSDPMTGAGTDGGWITTADNATVEPYGAFYVQRKVTAGSGEVTVKFTPAMQAKWHTADSGDTPSQISSLRMTVSSASGSSAAALAYTTTASNGFGDDEDVQVIEGVSRQSAEVPLVYTVAGDMAVSVNLIKDQTVIPLGVYADEGEPVTLTFSNVASLQQPVLYDAVNGSETPLTEGYTLELLGSSHGRYFLSAEGSTTGITETATGSSDVTVYSPVADRLVVASGSGMRSVSVWSVGGALLRSENPAGLSCVIDGIHDEVVIVKVNTDNGTKTVKLNVK